MAFGQITVRKLRKNPKTKDALGMEFVSGWDILNVAGALSKPKCLTKKRKQPLLSFLAADVETLYKQTTQFDRIFFWSFYASGIFMMVIAFFHYFV